MDALLQFLAEQTGLSFAIVGIALIVATWLPFSFTAKGLSLRTPTQAWPRALLSILGVSLLIVGSYFSYAKSTESPVFKPIIVDYLSYVSLVGGEADCRAGKCKLEYFTSGEFRAPWPMEARYIGRIKTGGRVDKFKSIPPYDILNPEQYPANPTYLEFAINPRPGSERVLRAQTDLTIVKSVTADKGKIGAHLPYFAKKAVLIVDFRTLGFTIPKQFSARLESANAGGVLRTGLIDPVRWDFAEGKVVSITATNVPANSSLVLVWGE